MTPATKRQSDLDITIELTRRLLQHEPRSPGACAIWNAIEAAGLTVAVWAEIDRLAGYDGGRAIRARRKAFRVVQGGAS